MSGGGDQEDGYVVKLRGLPWSATVDDVLKFFNKCKVLDGKNGVHLTSTKDGRPSGEAYVELETEDDMERALEKDRDHIGTRYIEVFRVEKSEMEWMVKRSGGSSQGEEDDGCVRLRGLPFDCSKEEIAQFFTGLEIVANGITLLTDYSGRSSGEAYVQFVGKDVAEKALQKHRGKIGHRYIEIFRSSLADVESALGYGRRSAFNSRPGPYDRNDRYGGGGGERFQGRGSRNFKGYNFSNDYNYDRPFNRSGNSTGSGRSGMDSWNSGENRNSHWIRMRGLPFKASQMDIAEFFKPIVPLSIRILQDRSGRASGDAEVEFSSNGDALKAMNKHKSMMHHRYIELFLRSGEEW